MSGGCFAERLNDFVTLTASERDALDRLQDRERTLKRSATVFRENDRNCDLFVVEKGMLMSYVVLHDGSRQILRFLFPGDIGGLSTVIYQSCPESVEALTDATICPIDRSALSGVFSDHPRLAALIFAINQIERVALTDRLAGLGRTSAKARIAAILLVMRDHLRRAHEHTDSSFALGLTQEEVGDATGLTAVHVNRMLRELEDERLIGRQNGRFTFLNEAALRKAANFVDRYANLDLSWLPAPR